MSTTLLQTSLLACSVAASLAGGATFAFSNFIMRAFDRLPGDEAVRAMQSINVTAINPLFMLLLIGTGVAGAGLSIVNLVAAGSVNPWLLGAAAVYVLGVVLVTMLGNVPLNEALARISPESLTATSWSAYAAPWTAWNHVRTVAAAVACVAFAVAAFH